MSKLLGCIDLPLRLFLDANVLYGDLLRNLLLRLAAEKVCVVHWSMEVQREWKQHLVTDAGYSEAVIERTQQRMEAAFPTAEVTDYEALIPQLRLPDPDDRHVLAAALKAEADVLVTFNLKDFPSSASANLTVQHPDEMIQHLFLTNPEGCQIALNKLVASLKNPPMTVVDIAAALERNQLPRSAALLRMWS